MDDWQKWGQRAHYRHYADYSVVLADGSHPIRCWCQDEPAANQTATTPPKAPQAVVQPHSAADDVPDDLTEAQWRRVLIHSLRQLLKGPKP